MKSSYEFLEKIGRGGQATTWKARHRESGRIVAIKELHFHAAEEWKTVELFERETEVLRSMKHPDIPDYVDAFTDEGNERVSLYLVQEFVDGSDLLESLRSRGRWSEEDARRDLINLLEILVYLHDRVPPIVHRDIKPSNLIRRSNGRLCLVDFGAALLHTNKTVRSTIIGTPGYMPMEQMIGQAEPRSDLYSLGVTLGHLMSGRDPSQIELSGTQLNFRTWIDSKSFVLRIVEKLTEPEVSKRFANAREVLDALTAPVRTFAQPSAPSLQPWQNPSEIQPLRADFALLEFLFRANELDGIPSVLPNKRKPHSFASIVFSRKGWVVDRPEDPQEIQTIPKLQAAQHLGFSFVGRQTRFTGMDSPTRQVWLDPTGQVYLIYGGAKPRPNNQGKYDELTLVTFLEDGSSVRQHVNSSGGLEGKHWNLKASGDLVADYKRQLVHLAENVHAENRPVTGLSMDAVMGLFDVEWFGLTKTTAKQKGIGDFLKALLTGSVLILLILLIFYVLLPIWFFQLYKDYQLFRHWRRELQTAKAVPTPSEIPWFLPSLDVGKAQEQVEQETEVLVGSSLLFWAVGS